MQNTTTVYCPSIVQEKGTAKNKNQAYTNFLMNNSCERYLSYPRKKKKFSKRVAKSLYYYDRKEKRVFLLNPHLLSMPISSRVLEWFKFNKNPDCGSTMVFRRPQTVNG